MGSIHTSIGAPGLAIDLLGNLLRYLQQKSLDFTIEFITVWKVIALCSLYLVVVLYGLKLNPFPAWQFSFNRAVEEIK